MVPPSDRPAIRVGRLVVAVIGLGVAVSLGGFFAIRAFYPTSQPSRSAVSIALVAPHPTGLTEAEILAQRADKLIIVRFEPNPRILVLDFPSLVAQGMAFNRMAAFIEKRGLSRDRVLNDQELAEALELDHSTVATYYYGHDYKAADVARFFATAQRQNLLLGAAEKELFAVLSREGLLADRANASVISIPRVGSDPFVDASGRASLLRHELSHGEYFTNPAYAEYVRQFWTDRMTADDRTAFGAFLSQQGYDPDNFDLMANETQAHLMHTTDSRYFNARACGIPLDRITRLREIFLAEMPVGWLRDAAMASRAILPD